MRKIPKHWRITPQLIDRMTKLRKPQQTETDFVEDAIYEKAVRDEEALRSLRVGLQIQLPGIRQ